MERENNQAKGRVKRILFFTVLFLAITVSSAYAGTIRVTLLYRDGSKCSSCRVSNDYNLKKVFTDRNGTAIVDVGAAKRRIQIYVDGSNAACARVGDNITIRVKGCGMGSTCPVYPNKCR